MSGLMVTAAVFVLALRSARAELGDGPISFTPVLIYGTVLLALPFALVVYRTARSSRRPTVTVGAISVAYAIFIATTAPGNLMFVGLTLGLACAIGLLWLTGVVLRRSAR